MNLLELDPYEATVHSDEGLESLGLAFLHLLVAIGRSEEHVKQVLWLVSEHPGNLNHKAITLALTLADKLSEFERNKKK